jgi:hypothetical protein
MEQDHKTTMDLNSYVTAIMESKWNNKKKKLEIEIGWMDWIAATQTNSICKSTAAMELMGLGMN